MGGEFKFRKRGSRRLRKAFGPTWQVALQFDELFMSWDARFFGGAFSRVGTTHEQVSLGTGLGNLESNLGVSLGSNLGSNLDSN